MKNTNKHLPAEESIIIIEAVYNAWQSGYLLRKTRERNKNFTYGRQLGDVVTNVDGETMTEKQALINNGKEPLTNNLIRQLVKSVVGRYRTISGEKEIEDNLKKVYEDNLINEMDARLLEEFLISGCCVQKVGYKQHFNNIMLGVDNVNINSFFVNAISDPRALDCSIIGELHDWSIAEIIMNLAEKDKTKAAWIRSLYANDINSRICNMQTLVCADSQRNISFWNSSNGKCRIIEAWTLETREIIRCHDYENGTLYTLPASESYRIEKENSVRNKNNVSSILFQWDIMQVWRCRWLTPMGDIISQYDSPYLHHSHPYVIKMYPLTDGEIHAFVEDVIDQQKYVNRLITLVDHIMNASAKGVLLYPSDGLPSGFT